MVQLWPTQYDALKKAVTEMSVNADVRVASCRKVQGVCVEAGMQSDGGETSLVGSSDSSSSNGESPVPVMKATALPEKRILPAFPEGDVTQADGEAICEMICNAYPEVFDGNKGHFRGAEATMYAKKDIWTS